jgi:uncharacterized membrane protein YedE/YeeE
MKQIAFSLACGLVFGAGLVLSGMTDPEKIHAFLAAKDASMAFVMGSAVITCAALYAIARRRNPAPFAVTKSIDGKLVTGAAIFGVGWGLVGACPAPAIVALGSGAAWSAIFVVAMIAGARIEATSSRLAQSRLASSRPPPGSESGSPAPNNP